jgi:glycosyltransferase involved in cell wall biosynthesis
MNIFFDHVDWNSSAGPHWFAAKLAVAMSKKGHEITHDNPDVQLAFVEMTQQMDGVPLVQRLDGIWYNTKTNYKAMNEQIKKTYDVADGVVFQSKFDRDFIIHHFGEPNRYEIIHNGADMNNIENIPEATGLDAYESIWCCASDWNNGDGTPRHNKRLNENLRYFQEHSGEKDLLCVAGDVGNIENPDPQKIVFLGNLAVHKLISLYKKADWFVHLAAQDHCPNVVVDAKSSGCRIVCSGSGGTPEIAGKDAIIIVDENEHGYDAWDYNVPTTLDFSRSVPGLYEADLSIDFVADRYLEFLEKQIK